MCLLKTFRFFNNTNKIFSAAQHSRNYLLGSKDYVISAPTARSPRAATHDSRLAEKFVDFEEL